MKTESEETFESFLTQNKLLFKKIPTGDSPRPDYCVDIGDLKIVFEVKQFEKDENYKVFNDPNSPIIAVHTRKLSDVGKRIRASIKDSKRQIQYGASEGMPSILIIYNVFDSNFQTFATEDSDFMEATRREFKTHNSSFSALGRLTRLNEELEVTLFDNESAKVRVPYNRMPPCFLKYSDPS